MGTLVKLALKEFWEHSNKHGWDFDMMYQHCWRLFNTTVSTKEALEDMFGHVSRRNRADMQNATQMSVERCFFHASVNPRFMSEAWPMLRLQPGDLLSSEATSYKTGRGTYLPCVNTKTCESHKRLKELIDAGHDFERVETKKNPNKITLLRVIPTITFIHFVTGKSSGILSDIPPGILSGISSGILPGISSGILSGISSGILSGKSSGILSGKHSGTLSGISSGILSGISSDILSGISSDILSGISSGTLSGISFGILSGISFGILSDILSGISSGILSGR